jgi:hypothetical protein
LVVVASQALPLTESKVVEALPKVVKPVTVNVLVAVKAPPTDVAPYKVLAPLPVIVPPVEILEPILVAALIMPMQARVANIEIIITLVMPPPMEFLF